MLKYFCFIISVFIQVLAGGQSTHTSIKKEDTLYVTSVLSLGSDYQNSHIDSALYLAETALSFSKQKNYLQGEIYSLNLKGVVFVISGDYSKALKTFLEALELCEKANVARATSMVLTNLGDLYQKQGEIRKALDYTLLAKKISDSTTDSINICVNYINLGNVYEAGNYLDSARINSQIAYEIAQKIYNSTNSPVAKDYIGVALNNLGNISSKSKQFTLALEYYRLSFPYFISTQDFDGLCESYIGLAKIFKLLNRNDSALFYAKKSYAIATSQRFNKFIYEASAFISGYYENAKNIDSAFAYQTIMVAAKDSLFSQEKVKQLQSLSIGEALRQQEITEEKRKVEEERKNNLQYVAIAIFIFLFSLFIILVSWRRIKLSTINFMVTVALLLVFEFISLLIHPYISVWTHHSPVFMLLILVVVAALLVPGHHRLEHWIKETLAHKIIHPRTRKIVVKKSEE